MSDQLFKRFRDGAIEVVTLSGIEPGDVVQYDDQPTSDWSLVYLTQLVFGQIEAVKGIPVRAAAEWLSQAEERDSRERAE